jgi:hypothetical protein
MTTAKPEGPQTEPTAEDLSDLYVPHHLNLIEKTVAAGENVYPPIVGYLFDAKLEDMSRMVQRIHALKEVIGADPQGRDPDGLLWAILEDEIDALARLDGLRAAWGEPYLTAMRAEAARRAES